MTWYKSLITKIEVSATGTVAAFLQTAAESGLFQKVPVGTGIDTSVSVDVAQWFNTVFNPWFAELSAKLGYESELEQLTSSGYSERINEVLIALWVARSYYAKQADVALITSLKNVALYKAAICEELALAVQNSYRKSVEQYGEFQYQGEVFTQTIASAYNGTTPETFTWPGTVVVNHIIFQDVEAGENNQEENVKSTGQKELLPWVFTAAFGVIALIAASSKPKL